MLLFCYHLYACVLRLLVFCVHCTVAYECTPCVCYMNGCSCVVCLCVCFGTYMYVLNVCVGVLHWRTRVVLHKILESFEIYTLLAFNRTFTRVVI